MSDDHVWCAQPSTREVTKKQKSRSEVAKSLLS